MPRVSRTPLKPYIKRDIVNEFWYTLGKLNTQEIYTLFKQVLTPTEIIMLAKRLAILRSLKEDTNYEDIRNIFKVTNGTISNMNAALMNLSPKGIKIIESMIKDENRHLENLREAKQSKGSMMIYPKKA